MTVENSATGSSNARLDPVTAMERADGLEREVWEALHTVEDPELPISVVDLGLMTDVAVENGTVDIELTLTYSGCPARDIIVEDIETAVSAIDGVDEFDVRVVPREWSLDRITDRGRRRLNEFGLSVPGDTVVPEDEA